MRRNAKSITTSPDIVSHIEGLTEANFKLLTDLITWLDRNEKAQRKFRNITVASLMRIEAILSLVLVGQQMDRQGKQVWFIGEKLVADAKAAEEFVERQTLERGKALMQYIHGEEAAPTKRRGRKRSWSGWEI